MTAADVESRHGACHGGENHIGPKSNFCFANHVLRHVHRVANMRRRAKRQPPPHSRTPLKSAVHPTYADAGVPKRPRHITVWTERPVCLRAPSPMPANLGFDVGPSRLASRGRPGKHPWALWHRSNPWTPEVG